MLIGLLLTYANVTVRMRERKRRDVLPTAVIYAIVFWSLWLYVSTELLSVPGWICRPVLAAVWLLYGIVQVLLLLPYRSALGQRLRQGFAEKGRDAGGRRDCGRVLVCLAFVMLAILVLSLAVSTIPYNCDSMVYHLARIEQWSSNGSVAHYATDNWRALSSTPFAEFVGLHIYVLSGGMDSLVNLVQAVSYLVICFLLFHTALAIGCSRRGGAVCAMIFAATPIALVEANTTQNDEFAAMWLVFFLYEILKIKGQKELLEGRNGGVLRCLVLALTVGFGYLAKPTIFPAIGLFTIWLLVSLWKKKVAWRQLAAWTIGTGAGAFAVILPEIGRNLATYHSISYYGVGARQIVGTARPTYLLINFLKNLSMNLPAIYWPNVYWRFESAVYKLAEILGVAINDPSIAETGVVYRISRAPDYGCDTAVSFVIMALILLCTLGFVLRSAAKVIHGVRTREFHIGCPGYCTMAFLSFYVLLLIMRWEPYVNRYMLGYFAAVTPAVVRQLERLCGRLSDVSWGKGLVFGAVLMLSFVEFLNAADTVRLHTVGEKEKGTIASYFENGKDKEEDYRKAAELAAAGNHERIGLKLDAGCLEYPLLRMLREEGLEYEPVNVEGEAAGYERTDYQPDCILYIGEDLQEPVAPYVCHGVTYERITRISDACYVIEK